MLTLATVLVGYALSKHSQTLINIIKHTDTHSTDTQRLNTETR